MTCKKVFLREAADLAAHFVPFQFYAGQQSIYTLPALQPALMFRQTLVKVWNFPSEIQKGVLKHNFSSELKVSFGNPEFFPPKHNSHLLFMALSVDPLLAAGTTLLGKIQTPT